VIMTVHFMRAYGELLAATCHRLGPHAMAALGRGRGYKARLRYL
jgi:malate synthase